MTHDSLDGQAETRTRICKLLTIFTAAMAMVFAPQASAQAFGFGTSPVGTFSYSYQGISIQVPIGCWLSVSAHGAGRKITNIVAGVECIGPAAIIPGLLCNTKAQFRYTDSSGKTYLSGWSKSNPRCLQAQADFRPPASISPKTASKCGQLCVDAYVNSAKRATTCVQITK